MDNNKYWPKDVKKWFCIYRVDEKGLFTFMYETVGNTLDLEKLFIELHKGHHNSEITLLEIKTD